MSRYADLPDGILAWTLNAHGMSIVRPRTILRDMLASLLTHCRGAILSVQKPPAAQRNPRIGSSPLNHTEPGFHGASKLAFGQRSSIPGAYVAQEDLEAC